MRIFETIAGMGHEQVALWHDKASLTDGLRCFINLLGGLVRTWPQWPRGT